MTKLNFVRIIVGLLLLSNFYFCKNTTSNTQSDSNHSEAHHDHQHESTATLKNPENQKLLDEIMAAHDEVMPKMGYMADLQAKLTALSKTTKDKANSEKLTSAAQKLADADEAMMVWMEKFPEGFTNLSDAEVNKILLSQSQSVSALKVQILEAISTAEQLLK